MTTNVLLALGLVSCFGFGGMVMVSQQEEEKILEYPVVAVEGESAPAMAYEYITDENGEYIMLDGVEAADLDEIDNVLVDCPVIYPEGEVPLGIAYEYVLDENGNYVLVDGSGVEVSEFDEIFMNVEYLTEEEVKRVEAEIAENGWEEALDCSVMISEGEIPMGIAYEYVLDENGNYVMVDGSGVEVSEFDELYDYDGSIKEGDVLPVFPVGTATGAVTWSGATTRGVK